MDSREPGPLRAEPGRCCLVAAAAAAAARVAVAAVARVAVARVAAAVVVAAVVAVVADLLERPAGAGAVGLLRSAAARRSNPRAAAAGGAPLSSINYISFVGLWEGWILTANIRGSP
eukprot:SAG31_NODE_4487_length_3194_cov_2.260743_3_plen_117_part_00